MDLQILDRALQDSSCYDIDVAIKSLSELYLPPDSNRITCSAFAEKVPQDHQKLVIPDDGTADWVELVIGEMTSATSVEDARARATRVLKGFEKSIGERLEKENMVLKRAVCVLLKRQKELDDRGRELKHMKELMAQQQEQLRALEAINYSLNLHLKQAMQCNYKYVPNPNVF